MSLKMTDKIRSGHGIMKPGQDLVAAGYIALKGTSVIAAEREQELLQRFTMQFVRRCQNLYHTRGLSKLPGISALKKADSWYPAGEGGVMTALWNYFEEFNLGYGMELRKLPVLQETIEICEVFDLNPYRLRSEGCVLFTAANGGDLVRELGEYGIYAVVLGKVEKGIQRRIRNSGNITFLDRPKPDELYKDY